MSKEEEEELLSSFCKDAKDINRIYPNSREEAQAIIRDANAKKLSIYPLGNGTKIQRVLEDKIPSGIFLVTKNLNKVVQYRPDNMSIEIEGGMSIKELNQFLAKDNLFFPVSDGLPGETVGGMVASNSLGRKKHMYNSIRHYVLGLEFISPTGELIKVGGRTIKNVSGYDISQLLTGSWGHLGLITKVTLRLKPIPQQKVVMEKRVANLSKVKELALPLIAKGFRMAAFCIKTLDGEIILQLQLEGIKEIIDIQSQQLADGYDFKAVSAPMDMQEKMPFKVVLDLDKYMEGLETIKKWTDTNDLALEFQGIITNGIIDFTTDKKPDHNMLDDLSSAIKCLGGTLYYCNNSQSQYPLSSQNLLQNIKKIVDPNGLFMTSSKVLKE